ncbi:MAG: hypothetical protein AB9833_04240 [Bacteroidales bacterium]
MGGNEIKEHFPNEKVFYLHDANGKIITNLSLQQLYIILDCLMAKKDFSLDCVNNFYDDIENDEKEILKTILNKIVANLEYDE